jgi:hypothetical protein
MDDVGNVALLIQDHLVRGSDARSFFERHLVKRVLKYLVSQLQCRSYQTCLVFVCFSSMRSIAMQFRASFECPVPMVYSFSAPVVCQLDSPRTYISYILYPGGIHRVIK